jgi:FixJ family two-component response regulator
LFADLKGMIEDLKTREAGEVLKQTLSFSFGDRIIKLTPEELKTMSGVSQGKTAKEIATEQYKSVKTINFHSQRYYIKIFGPSSEGNRRSHGKLMSFLKNHPDFFLLLEAIAESQKNQTTNETKPISVAA